MASERDGTDADRYGIEHRIHNKGFHTTRAGLQMMQSGSRRMYRDTSRRYDETGEFGYSSTAYNALIR